MPQPIENGASTEPQFLQTCLANMQKYIKNMSAQLDTITDLLDTRAQALHRLHLSSVEKYFALEKKVVKNETANIPTEEKSSDKSEPLPPEWRDDIKRFAKEALNLDLLPHQLKFCLSEKRINLMIAGRGAGKSVAARVKAIHNACLYENHTVLVVSSGQRMSKDFGTKLLDLIRESPLQSQVVSMSAEEAQFKNGSVLKFLPANPDTIRGYHPKTGKSHTGITVVLDEACFMEQGDEIRKAVEYALITTPKQSGRLYIVTSPSTVGSWVHEYTLMAQKEEADIAVIQCASFENPSISKEEIERLQATKNDLEYRAEVLGEWVDGAYGLFSGLLESNQINEDQSLPPGAISALGVDLALSFTSTHDRNALAVIAKWYPEETLDELEARYRLLDVIALDRASDKEIRTQIKMWIKKYNLSSAVIEQYQGKALAEFCQNLGLETKLTAPTSGLQQTVFHEMHRLLRQGLLELPSSLPPLFFEEMRAFEYRREPNGHITFGHPASGKTHDDTVYATAWAIHAANLSPPKPYTITNPHLQFIDRF